MPNLAYDRDFALFQLPEEHQGALDAATAYTKDREQFGRPVSDDQGVQFMLADMITQICEGTNQIQRVVMRLHITKP